MIYPHFSLSLCLSILLTLCACSSSEQKEDSPPLDTLTFNMTHSPEGLHPQLYNSLASTILQNALFEGLTRLNSAGEAELALADSIEISQDAKHYLFHLRPCQWSDGNAITAYDFEYAWKHALRPESTAANTDYLYVIKNAEDAKLGRCLVEEVGVEALDAETLLVDLERPCTHLSVLVSSPIFFPIPQSYEASNPLWADEGLACNGPFKLKHWRQNDEILLEANPHYWDATSVKLSRLAFTIADPATELLLYQSGQLSWAGSPLGSLPIEALEAYRDREELHLQAAAATDFLRFNTEEAPFNHAKIRRAFSLAINRQALVDHLLLGDKQPAQSLIPPLAGWETTPLFQDHSAREARILLREGLAEQQLSNLAPITLVYTQDNLRHKIAQALQQQWQQELGVEVKLQSYERRVFLQKVKSLEYQTSLGNWFADIADPINFLELFESQDGGNNRTRWFDPTYTQLLSDAKMTLDAEKRAHYLREAEARLIADMPIAPLYFKSFAYFKQAQVSGVHLSNLGLLDFKHAELTSRS